MISVHLQGGLGNHLFQIAKCIQVSRETGRRIWLPVPEKTVHSDQDYFSTIFRSISHTRQDYTNYVTIPENQDYRSNAENIQLSGYFQDYRNIPDDFSEYLTLPDVDPMNGAFLHIRGGDYKGHWLHDIGLTVYYERAIQLFPIGTMFYIFTNDIEYAKTLPFLDRINHQYIKEKDEVKCLAMMKSCSVGGICANSTFSWWGAYLQRNNRMLVLPSRWFNDTQMSVTGYFFPEATVLYAV